MTDKKTNKDETIAASTTTTSPALTAQAESVFESYLAARLIRARRELTAAKIALLRDAQDRTKLEALRHAEREVERFQAELIAQTRKVTQARTRAETMSADTATTAEERRASIPSPVALAIANAKPSAPTSVVVSANRTQPDDRECPRCNRRVRGDVTACSCGHKFSTADATHLTAQFLSEEEFLALRATPPRSTK